jgi:hypothetical protein
MTDRAWPRPREDRDRVRRRGACRHVCCHGDGLIAMMEVWYILEDGSMGDPHEIALKDGRLQHKDGRAVAHAPHGPRTRSVDADAERAKAAKRVPKAPDRAPVKSSEERQSPSYERRDMKPEASAQPYKTREMKSD